MIQEVPTHSVAVLLEASRGISPQAGLLDHEVAARRRKALAVHPLARVLDRVDELYDETQSENWNTALGERVPLRAIVEARRVLVSVPRTFPPPEVTLEPAGAIGIEWWFGPGHSFVVSVNGSGVLEYAGLFGPVNSAHGQEALLDRLPPPVLEGMRRVQRLWSSRGADWSRRNAQ